MRATSRVTPRRFAGAELTVWLALGLAVTAGSGGCHRDTAGAPAADAPAAGAPAAQAGGTQAKAGKDSKDAPRDQEASGQGVSLTAGDIEKMGIETVELKAVTRAPEASGFGVVMSHELIAQAAAELATAAATEAQSRAAYERDKRLAGTPGAMPAEALEAAQRQAAVDRASAELVKRRLSSTFGQHPPWKSADGGLQLSALASGDSKLVRVTFPLGALPDTTPPLLRFTRLGSEVGGNSFESRTVWSAPADASMPGKSMFAVLKGNDVSEGERLLVWAPVGSAVAGVLIPASAAVISEGRFWCYLEKTPGVFVRTAIDTSRPNADGYFVTHGVAAGDKVVTTSAGQLLARETNPSTAAE